MQGGMMAAPSGAWSVTGTWTPNVNSTGWNGLTLRQVVPVSALAAGSRLRFLIRSSGNATGFSLAKAYVGLQAGSGDSYDFASTPGQLLFSGNPNATVPGSNASLLSDALNFVQDGTAPLLLSAYFDATSNVGARSALTGWTSYFKAGDDAATVNATGYSSSANAANLFAQIEVFSP
jgi:hypothetical protein